MKHTNYAFNVKCMDTCIYLDRLSRHNTNLMHFGFKQWITAISSHGGALGCRQFNAACVWLLDVCDGCAVFGQCEAMWNAISIIHQLLATLFKFYIFSKCFILNEIICILRSVILCRFDLQCLWQLVKTIYYHQCIDSICAFISAKNDNGVQTPVGVMFCINMHVWKRGKMIPVLSDNCLQQPIITWNTTKKMTKHPSLEVWACVCELA